MVEFLIITGMSGAGRSTAADSLDDQGWFVIDNLPLPLFGKILELTARVDDPFEHVAFVLGAGSGQRDVMAAIDELRATGARVRVLYLDASSDVLVRRYEETRRRHPRGQDGSLLSAIDAERRQLEPLKADADILVDTSDLNVHQLRRRIGEIFSDGAGDDLQIRVSSFGYKRGLPLDVDLVFDCRFLPNPHWIPDLRLLNGRDEPVREFVLAQDLTLPFIDDLITMLERLIPAYVAEGKSFLAIAFGCTGGQHRSVVLADQVAQRLAALGHVAPVAHRDIDK